MRMFELLPRPLGAIFRKLTHLTCNLPSIIKPFEAKQDDSENFPHRILILIAAKINCRKMQSKWKIMHNIFGCTLLFGNVKSPKSAPR